jgi:hypothetical protein
MTESAESAAINDFKRLIDKARPADRRQLAAWCRKASDFLIAERLRSPKEAGFHAVMFQMACTVHVTRLDNLELAKEIQPPIFDIPGLFNEALAALGKAERWGLATLCSLTVSLDPPQAVLRGVAFALSPDQADFLDILVKADGDWRTGPKHFPHKKATRVRENLPMPLRDLVEARAPYGFRIDMSKLV